MSVNSKAHEPYGEQAMRDPLAPRDPLADAHTARVAKGSECSGLGHQWSTDGRACERCGKASSLPEGAKCVHGVPNGGRFGGHDCAYATARDHLIEYATLAADADLADEHHAHSDHRAEDWDASFHYHMDRLAKFGRLL